eukprot:11159064-Lingulodinium_polyedra.AAC.1
MKTTTTTNNNMQRCSCNNDHNSQLETLNETRTAAARAAPVLRSDSAHSSVVSTPGALAHLRLAPKS